jgi:hypothetical protein
LLPVQSLCELSERELTVIAFMSIFICGQGNVGPAAFWLLGFLLTNPEAMRAVKKEFSKISGQDSAQCPLLDRLQHTPVFGEGYLFPG